MLSRTDIVATYLDISYVLIYEIKIGQVGLVL